MLYGLRPTLIIPAIMVICIFAHGLYTYPWAQVKAQNRPIRGHTRPPPVSTRAPTYTADQMQLANKMRNLYLMRTNHSKRLNVPVYVLTQGGGRLDRFADEMSHEGVDFTVILTDGKIATDYRAGMEGPGPIGCTLAHLTFAKMLVRHGHKCALVAEDDASFSLSVYWPVDLERLCDEMIARDPLWTTLALYSSDTSAPRDNKPINVYRHTGLSWGTVCYLANQRWAQNLMSITDNATRLMKSRVGSPYGVSDSVVYQCKGCSAWTLIPNYVFPDNLQSGTLVGTQTEQSARNQKHVKSALMSIESSVGHFSKFMKPVK